jgi:hypothetical protein
MSAKPREKEEGDVSNLSNPGHNQLAGGLLFFLLNHGCVALR